MGSVWLTSLDHDHCVFVSMGFFLSYTHFALFVLTHVSYYYISQWMWELNDGSMFKRSADFSVLDKAPILQPVGRCPGPLRITRNYATASSTGHSFCIRAQIQQEDIVSLALKNMLSATETEGSLFYINYVCTGLPHELLFVFRAFFREYVLLYIVHT